MSALSSDTILEVRDLCTWLDTSKGTLRAVCEPPAEALDALAQARTNADGKAEAWIPVRVTTLEGQAVTDARFLASLKRFR